MISYPNAKINIGLSIVSKRQDGYHNIESIFYPINLTDILEIVPSNELTFNSSGMNVDCPMDSNLVVKAYQLLKQYYDIPPVAIHLHKVIPSGAGLGGGSADASFMINQLDLLFDLNIPIFRKKELASKLGSDCTFFIENKAAFVEGVGEQMSPVDLNLSEYKIVIINPGIHISTQLAYSKITPKRASFEIKNIAGINMSEWKNHIVNDFEEPMIMLHPSIGEIKSKLYEFGAIYASMTGSGSTLYGIFRKDIEIYFKSEFSNYFVFEC